jgi:hypothetical protein
MFWHVMTTQQVSSESLAMNASSKMSTRLVIVLELFR